MVKSEYLRWGKLLGVLSQMADVEYQLAFQVDESDIFLPDELLIRWSETFRGGRGLSRIGVSEHMLAILLDFDMHLDELIEYLPEEADNPVDYIRDDEVWRAIREMADWTLSRIAEMSIPETPSQSVN
jgi:hypothetical protein